jgi:hypothetical protein
MTTRLAMAVALLLVLLTQAWGLVSVLRDDPLRSLAVKGKKEASAAMMPGLQSLQPTPPAAPPDLNQGYLFSAERSLTGGGKGGKAQNAANVAIDKIHYSGSIITDKPKALLSFSLGGAEDSSGGGPQKQGFLRVAVGDTVNGYKVTEILPEKIIFSRDGQQITKLLYDKAKDRGLAPTPLSGRGPSGQMPAAQAPGQNALPVPAPAAAPAVKAAEPPRVSAPKKPVQPMPSDEELRKKPLRKRLEPPPE